ncbi:hypothetical protein D3C78_1483410 [compost metagenome]
MQLASDALSQEAGEHSHRQVAQTSHVSHTVLQAITGQRCTHTVKGVLSVVGWCQDTITHAGVSASVDHHHLEVVTVFVRVGVSKRRNLLVTRNDTPDRIDGLTVDLNRRQTTFDLGQFQAFFNCAHLVSGAGFAFVRRKLHSVKSP